MKEYEIRLKLNGHLSFTLTAENLKDAKERADDLTDQLIQLIRDNRPKIESLNLRRSFGCGVIREDHTSGTSHNYVATAPVKGDLVFNIVATELEMGDIKKAVVAMAKTVQKILNKKSELNPELNVFDFNRIELAEIKAKR